MARSLSILSRNSISRSWRSLSWRSRSVMYLGSSYLICIRMGRSGLYSSDGLISSRRPYISPGGGLPISIGRGGPAPGNTFGWLLGLGGTPEPGIRPWSLACSAAVRGGPL